MKMNTTPHIDPLSIKEVWTIQWEDTGIIVPPGEDFGGDEFLGFPTREQAERAAASTLDDWGEAGQKINVIRLLPSFWNYRTISSDDVEKILA